MFLRGKKTVKLKEGNLKEEVDNCSQWENILNQSLKMIKIK